MHIDRTMYPDFFNDYILYISITKSLSERTIQEYFLDIRTFLRYLKYSRHLAPSIGFAINFNSKSFG